MAVLTKKMKNEKFGLHCQSNCGGFWWEIAWEFNVASENNHVFIIIKPLRFHVGIM